MTSIVLGYTIMYHGERKSQGQKMSVYAISPACRAASGSIMLDDLTSRLISPTCWEVVIDRKAFPVAVKS